MEFGDTTESGAPALFERLPIFRAIADRRPEYPLLFKQLTALRRDHPALRSGQTRWLPTLGEDRIVTFLRNDAKEELLVAINLSNRPWQGRVLALPEPLHMFRDVTPNLRPGTQPGTPSSLLLPDLNLPAWGFRIVQRKLP